MTIATDPQVQTFVDDRIRPHSELVRGLLLALQDDKLSIDDVYAALTQDTPTWTDTNQGTPPHFLSGADVLAINAFVTDTINLWVNHASYPIVIKACVRKVG